MQHRRHDTPRRPVHRRRASLWLGAGLSLATGLAFAAPLAHAHFEASAFAQGLCGEHLPAESGGAGAEACTICGAGSSLPAALAGAAFTSGSLSAGARVEPPAARADSRLRRRPGAPRAPPHPA